MPKGKKNRPYAASSQKGGKNDTRKPLAADCQTGHVANENKEINNMTRAPAVYKSQDAIKLENDLVHSIDAPPRETAISGGTGSIATVVSSSTLPCAMKN